MLKKLFLTIRSTTFLIIISLFFRSQKCTESEIAATVTITVTTVTGLLTWLFLGIWA